MTYVSLLVIKDDSLGSPFVYGTVQDDKPEMSEGALLDMADLARMDYGDSVDIRWVSMLVDDDWMDRATQIQVGKRP